MWSSVIRHWSKPIDKESRRLEGPSTLVMWLTLFRRVEENTSLVMVEKAGRDSHQSECVTHKTWEYTSYQLRLEITSLF